MLLWVASYTTLMPKLYATLGLILLLTIGLWKFWDFAGDYRENQLKAKTLDTRVKAESQIVKDRIVYRDRIQKIREVVVQCDLPVDLISLLRESGVFSREVRDTVHN